MSIRNFYLTYRVDGVFLHIAGRERDDDKRIASYLMKKKLQGFNLREVMAQVAAGKTEILVGVPQSENVLGDSVTVTLPVDEQTALIVIEYGDEGGTRLTADAIKGDMQKARVTRGIDEELLAELERKPRYYESIVAAKAIPAVNGCDAQIEYHFALSHTKLPKELEGGRVNFRELDLFEDVSAGQLLATRTPATLGEPGCTVTGRELKAKPGRMVKLLAGANTHLSEDGNQITAVRGGRVDLINNKVVVSDLFIVKENVDMGTGNITFDGDVQVMGGVISGMSIKATGSIEIYGVVEGALLNAGGSIVLKQGVQGVDKAELRAGGDVVARFIEHSTVTAMGNVQADVIIHSEVACARSVIATRGRGAIFSSTVRAGEMIVSRIAGSSSHAHTQLEIALDPRRYELLKNARAEYDNKEREAAKAAQTIALLEKRPSTPEGGELLQRVRKTLAVLTQGLSDLSYDIKELELANQEIRSGKIHVIDLVNEGVKIVIAGAKPYSVTSAIPFATFKLVGEEVAMMSCEYQA